MPHINGELSELIDRYLALAASEENRRRLQYWEPEVCARDQFHGRPLANAFRDSGVAPVEIDIQHTFFTQFYPANLTQIYHEPEAYLAFYLSKRLFAFQNIPDDTPLDGVIPIYMSSIFDPALMGVPYHYFPDMEPMIDQTAPLVRSREDLDRLPPIDFTRSGVMPQAIRIYERVREIVDGRLKVVFPEWIRGPFGMALYLRGYQDLLVDMVADPEFAHQIMARVNTERKAYFEARARYLGEPIPTGSLFNDEVDAGVISARHYRDHIRPYEEDLAAFHKRITYWHSCGNTAPMAGSIAERGDIDLLDVSGWTNLAAVLPTIDTARQRLEIRFDPVKDLQGASPEHMKAVLTEKIRLCQTHGVGAFVLRASGIQPWENPADDLAQVNRWVVMARELLEENRRQNHRS